MPLRVAPRPSTPPRATLADLEVGDEAVVIEVKAEPAEVERLAALGLLPGVSLRLLRQGSMLAVAVGEARIALGRRWAQALCVVPA
jgi:Fe2+ transport system protein FeoA